MVASKSSWRREIVGAALAAMIAISLSTYAPGQSTVEEYKVKAAFLFHFAQLIEWPAGPDGNGSLMLCTYGEDPFAGELESTVEGKQIGSRQLRVRHVVDFLEVHQCQMVFVGKGNSKQEASLLEQLGGAPVVTVGESDDFLNQGGVIRFCLDDNKVRFEINATAAERARLKVSSRLLMLAKRVLVAGRSKH